jgi:hypothetical protein
VINLWSIVIGIFFLVYFLYMRETAKLFGYDSLSDFEWSDWVESFILSVSTMMITLGVLFLGTIAYVSINCYRGTEQKIQTFEQECFSKGGILNKALDSRYTTCTLKGD